MSVDLDKYLTEIDKLPSELGDLKEQLTTMFKTVNKDKGEALSDLNGLKDKNKELSNTNGQLQQNQTTYQTLTKLMKDMNIDVENADKFAEQLNIQKTDTDKFTQLEDIAKQAQEKNKELEGQLRSVKIKDTIEPLLKTALDEFKDKDGNPYKLVDKFIDKKELYNPKLDLESDVLVQDAITKVLLKGQTEQDNFIAETGAVFDEKKVHDVNVNGERHFNNNGGKPELSALETQMRDSGGDSASVGRYLDAALEQK